MWDGMPMRMVAAPAREQDNLRYFEVKLLYFIDFHCYNSENLAETNPTPPATCGVCVHDRLGVLVREVQAVAEEQRPHERQLLELVQADRVLRGRRRFILR